MVDNAEDKLFHKTLNDTSHVLSQLLPERRNELTYSPRTRRHDRTLSQRATGLTDNSFITRRSFLRIVISIFSHYVLSLYYHASCHVY